MGAADEPPDDGRASPDELVGIAQLREWLGVAKSRAYTISRYRDFPAPWYVGERERLWRLRDIAPWLDRERPGWRGTPAG